MTKLIIATLCVARQLFWALRANDYSITISDSGEVKMKSF
jgi:hypothetical protein